VGVDRGGKVVVHGDRLHILRQAILRALRPRTASSWSWLIATARHLG
jgi:hypothetical protein